MTAILKDYIIIKDSDEQRSDLNRRIKYYLGAKRIDGAVGKDLEELQVQPRNVCRQGEQERCQGNDRRHPRLYRVPCGEPASCRNQSANAHQTHCRHSSGWLRIEKIKKNPMAKIKSLKLDKKGARQALTVEELERLRDACQGYREKALVEFLVSSGCRLVRSHSLTCPILRPHRLRTVRVTGKGERAFAGGIADVAVEPGQLPVIDDRDGVVGLSAGVG